MSDLKAKQQALTEQAYHERAQRTIREIEFKERRAKGQGLMVGYMAGSFGESTQVPVVSTFFRILPMFNLFLVAGWLIYILATAG